MRALDGEKVEVDRPRHPIEIMARAYGIAAEED
jgi:hypothetical protein